MKKILFLIFSAILALPSIVMAQENLYDMKQVKPKDVLQADSLASLEMNKDCILPPSVGPQPCARTEYLDRGRQNADTLNLPTLNIKGQVPLMTYPYDGWWGVNNWTLHKGLNVNLGASVFAAFGKGAPKGAGFAQDLSMMYALPLTKRLTLAIGGWVSNAYWAHDRFTDAGVSAVLGYKFDEHWEAYVYGRKSLVNKPIPYRFCTMDDLGDRIGAAVKYNFSPSFSVQVSVSMGQRNYRNPYGGMFGSEPDMGFGGMR